MPRAARFRLALILIAAVSLMAKSAYANFYPQGDDARMGRDIAAVYQARGYAVSIEDRGALPPIITARRGRCTVMTRDASYMQTSEFGNQQRMGSAGPLQQAFRGAYFANERRLGIEIYTQLKREQARFGMTVEVDPVLAVAATPACRPPAAWFDGLTFRIR